MKKTIRLTESELTNMIQEAINELASEGKRVNHKNDYFDGSLIQQRDSNHVWRPYLNPKTPGSKYAQRDNKPPRYKNDNVVTSPKSWDELKELGFDVTQNYDNAPQNDFEVAALKHSLRRDRADNNIDNGGKVGPWFHRAAITNVAKLGVPMDIAYKLSFQTLQQILKELN